MVCCSAQKSTSWHWFSSMPRVVDVGCSHCLLSFLKLITSIVFCFFFQFMWLEWVLLFHQFIFLFSVLSLLFFCFSSIQSLRNVAGFFFLHCSHWFISVTGEWDLCALRHGIKHFNGCHFDLPPSSIHRMTGLGGNFMWTMTYSHSPHSFFGVGWKDTVHVKIISCRVWSTGCE